LIQTTMFISDPRPSLLRKYLSQPETSMGRKSINL
jgi:hypothetical protein